MASTKLLFAEVETTTGKYCIRILMNFHIDLFFSEEFLHCGGEAESQRSTSNLIFVWSLSLTILYYTILLS